MCVCVRVCVSVCVQACVCACVYAYVCVHNIQCNGLFSRGKTDFCKFHESSLICKILPSKCFFSVSSLHNL